MPDSQPCSTTRPPDPFADTCSPLQVWLAKHDKVGGRRLREIGFSERLARLVEGHVQAKR